MKDTTHPSELTRRFTSTVLFPILIGAGACLTSCGKNEGGGAGSPAGPSAGESASTASTTAGGKSTPAAKAEPDLPPLDHPASPGEAARYLDLSTLPAMEGADVTKDQTVANMSYRVAADVKAAYEFHKKQLSANKWKELPDGNSVTDEYASSTFERAGFHVSLMINKAGDPGKIEVSLHNHGNVNLAKLPLPAGTKTVYAGPITAMYSTEAPAPATAEECRKLLLAEGWEPYGGAGDAAYFRRNGVQVQVSVAAAPAQDGKTMISFLSEQMSAAIPVPPDAEDPRYTDSQKKLQYATTGPKESVSAFYKEALGKTGWKPNKDEWFEQDGKQVIVFRNPENDMLWLEFNAAGGKGDVSLAYQTGAEIAAMNKKLDAQAEAFKAKRKAEMEKPVVTLKMPTDAALVSASPNEVKLTINSGFAKVAADEWNEALHTSGWLLSTGTSQGGVGTLVLRREGQTMTINFDDSNRNPAPLSVSTTGVGVEVK